MCKFCFNFYRATFRQLSVLTKSYSNLQTSIPMSSRYCSKIVHFGATVCNTVRHMVSDRCLSVLSVCNIGVLWPNIIGLPGVRFLTGQSGFWRSVRSKKGLNRTMSRQVFRPLLVIYAGMCILSV